MKKIWVGGIIAVFFLIAPLCADEVSHRKAAAKLLETTNVPEMLEQVKASVEATMAQQLKTLNLPEEGRAAAAKAQQEMMAWFCDLFSWKRTQDMYVEIYVETFTEDELNQLIAFNQSPLGQKVLKKMPEIMQRSITQTHQLLLETEPEIQRRLRRITQELEQKYKI
jgi:hypothetical protein